MYTHDSSAAVWYMLWSDLQGCVVPIHVSMEGSVQRPETRYVSVHWASKGRDANMVSFQFPSHKIVINLHTPLLALQAFIYSNKLSAALWVSELTCILGGQHVVKALIGLVQTLCFHFAKAEWACSEAVIGWDCSVGRLWVVKGRRRSALWEEWFPLKARAWSAVANPAEPPLYKTCMLMRVCAVLVVKKLKA